MCGRCKQVFRHNLKRKVKTIKAQVRMQIGHNIVIQLQIHLS